MYQNTPSTVADFKSSYHVILGRPMLARFMVVLH
jgi:hypothetical protein